MRTNYRYGILATLCIALLFCGEYAWGQNIASQLKSTENKSPKGKIFTTANYQGKRFQFIPESNFDGTIFASQANFNRSCFNLTASFDSTHFSSTSNFIAARFYSMADFIDARFDSIADFHSAHFYSTVDFIDTHFYSTVDFHFAHFDSLTDFSYAHFKSTADFQQASFGNNCNFDFTILPDTLDFRYITRVKEEIDFTSSTLDSNKKIKCVIFLYGTDISKVKINMQLFEIRFTDDEVYEQRTSVYEKLLAKFKQEGFEESYQLLDIEYRRYKLTYNKLTILDWFQTNWWNYGYNKEWVLTKWTPRAIVLFTLLNLLLLSRLHSGIYNLEFVAPILRDFHHWKAKRHSYPRRAFLKQGLPICAKYVLATLVYTSMIFFRLKIELEKSNIKKHPWLFLYTLMLYTIGLICTGFIANVIFTK
ncbi:MAG: pentapeptide repeat-containing protein [Candidatus Kapaibacteriota bacterium]